MMHRCAQKVAAQGLGLVPRPVYGSGVEWGWGMLAGQGACSRARERSGWHGGRSAGGMGGGVRVAWGAECGWRGRRLGRSVAAKSVRTASCSCRFRGGKHVSSDPVNQLECLLVRPVTLSPDIHTSTRRRLHATTTQSRQAPTHPIGPGSTNSSAREGHPAHR